LQILIIVAINQV